MTRRAGKAIAFLRRGSERLEGVGLWTLSHGASLWPAIAIAVVLGLTWNTLRGVHIRDVRAAMQSLDASWIAAAAGFTALNVAVMGLYDVVAFRDTRSSALERWRYGAVAFAWSNSLMLGPLAGPAIRFWLYASAIDRAADLRGGIVAITIAFTAGLAGWTMAVVIATRLHAAMAFTAILALGGTLIVVIALRWVAARLENVAFASSARVFETAVIGWLDWLLAAAAFLCAVRAGHGGTAESPLPAFFFGQVVGIASLTPGGFGSADAFWVARLPGSLPIAAAIVAVFRLVYYVVPWTLASLVLLSWATGRAARRIEIARRVIAGLIGGGGLLIMLSSASPPLRARLLALERFVPLPLVEFGQLVAAMTGLLLLALALKLARGYRAAFRATLTLLAIGAISALLKGIDWEEALVLGGLAAAAASHASLFDRESRGHWIEGADIVLATAAVAAFLVFGVLTHRSGFGAFEQWADLGYRLEASRFARSAIALALAVAAAAIYVALRAPATFRRPSSMDIDHALDLHATIGGSSTPLMAANGDKSIFLDGERGLCLYRIIGPYLVVFGDPVVGGDDRGEFLAGLFRFALEADRRPLFYQLSPEWIPALHDRGYLFFKLGEEGQLPLTRVTTDGPSGKLFRQILRRGERDGMRFRVMPPYEVVRRLDELRDVSDDWLASKAVVERQFSIGFFDREYLARFPCAVIETVDGSRIQAFANVLRGPKRGEMSIDLMRYHSDGPKVMDFLLVSLFLHAKTLGYERFNLGVAPLSSVGDVRGAHPRERLARLVFQHGEHWYNFQGLRFFKQKFDPDWQPRYLSYQSVWEFPVAIAYVSALIAGGWMKILSASDPGSTAAPPARAPGASAADR